MADRRLNRTSLIAGLLYLALGAMFLADRLGYWEMRTRYILPLLLVGLGIAVLAGERPVRVQVQWEAKERRTPKPPKSAKEE